jgi:hypothetical protein
VTDAERLRTVLAHVRQARKLLRKYAEPKQASKLVNDVRRVLDNPELIQAMTAARVSSAQADGKSSNRAKQEQAS